MAKFTSGHIRQIALVLKSEMPIEEDYAPILNDAGATWWDTDTAIWLNICKAFAIRLQQNNSNFDAAKFYSTCGIDDETIEELIK